MRAILLLAAGLAVSACTQLPDVPVSDEVRQSKTDYPDLINLRTLELRAAEQEAEDLKSEQETAARVANLRARAAELRKFEFN